MEELGKLLGAAYDTDTEEAELKKPIPAKEEERNGDANANAYDSYEENSSTGFRAMRHPVFPPSSGEPRGPGDAENPSNVTQSQSLVAANGNALLQEIGNSNNNMSETKPLPLPLQMPMPMPMPLPMPAVMGTEGTSEDVSPRRATPEPQQVAPSNDQIEEVDERWRVELKFWRDVVRINLPPYLSILLLFFFLCILVL